MPLHPEGALEAFLHHRHPYSNRSRICRALIISLPNCFSLLLPWLLAAAPATGFGLTLGQWMTWLGLAAVGCPWFDKQRVRTSDHIPMHRDCVRPCVTLLPTHAHSMYANIKLARWDPESPQKLLLPHRGPGYLQFLCFGIASPPLPRSKRSSSQVTKPVPFHPSSPLSRVAPRFRRAPKDRAVYCRA